MAKSARMLTEPAALDLIEKIYAAAEEPDLWPEFLSALATAVGGSLTTFLVQDTQGRQGFLSSAVNCDPEFVRRYDEHYCEKNLWMIHGKNQVVPGAVLTSRVLCSDDIMMKSEFFNEYLEPQNVYEQIGAMFMTNGQRFAAITTMRSRHDGPFEVEKERLLSVLVPHIRRAVLLHDRLQTMALDVDSYEAALDRTTLGVILFDATGSIARMNDAARRVIDAHDGLSVRRGELHASRGDEDARLHAMIRGAASSLQRLTTSPGDLMTISRPSMKASYEAMVTALPPRRRIFNNMNAAVVLFVTDPERPLEVDRPALQRLYGLTKAEARLAGMLAAGKSLDECAACQCVSRETIRTHLKRIFEKTDTSNRAELMLRLASSVAAATAREH